MIPGIVERITQCYPVSARTYEQDNIGCSLLDRYISGRYSCSKFDNIKAVSAVPIIFDGILAIA